MGADSIAKYIVLSIVLRMKSYIKKILPKSVRNLKHLFYAWYGAQVYHHPSEELFVIGVTGTSGKSSTIAFLRQVLESAGFRVGSLSTVDFVIAGEQKMNDQKMTMLGKMKIQQYLREMVDAQCDIAIIETTSEGRVQHRHRFINYDMMLLTNLYPEHIESHGSFEKYRQAKVDIFRAVATARRKKSARFKTLAALNQRSEIFIKKTAIVNGDSDDRAFFLLDTFDERYTFGKEKQNTQHTIHLRASDRELSKQGLRFSVDGHAFVAPILGEYNIMNILSVIATCRALGLDWKSIIAGVAQVQGVPGRLEFIPEAKKQGVDVIVDYAFEPVAIKALYKMVRLYKPTRIIHVFGSTGGGRDVSRRTTVGEYVGKKADICIVTDEDPYDDNPETIIADVMSAVVSAGKEEGKNAFRFLDRGKAIQAAIDMAQKGDMILVTGKGSEQAMVVKGKLIPWDDREAVRRALAQKKK